MSTVFDQTPCSLGEGPFWHPLRDEVFWFDIVGCRLYAKKGDKRRHWDFDAHVSAAGWIDRDTLLVAHERALLKFDIESGATEAVVALEPDNPVTRPNDGRADPWGGFWIGTMGKKAEEGAGAIYRYYRGELRRIFAPMTVPNAQCFAPDASCMYFADTPSYRLMRQRLDEATGWPLGEPEPFITFNPDTHRPDGAVVDAQGNLWIAQSRHGKVTCHAPDGREVKALPVPVRSTTCPAFIGPELDRLIVTTAHELLTEEQRQAMPDAGKTFELVPGARGQAEHQVIL